MDYSRHYSKWHDHNNPNYIKYIKRKYKRILEGNLPKNKDASILEIGCANGMALCTLKDMGYTNLLGVEISQDLAKIAQSFSLNIEVDDATDYIKRTDCKYDFIYLFDVLEHIEINKIPCLLKDIYNRLNDNGKLMMIIPNATSPAGSYFRYIDWTHQISFTPTSIAHLLEEAGFMDITISDESLIEDPYEEDYDKIEWYNNAKKQSESARFYESFARWQMASMFGSSKYNLLVAPNIRVICSKNDTKDIDLRIMDNSNIFDFQTFIEDTNKNRINVSESLNKLLLQHKNIDNEITNIIHENNEVKSIFNSKYYDILNRIDLLDEKMDRFSDDLKLLNMDLKKLELSFNNRIDENKRSIENQNKFINRDIFDSLRSNQKLILNKLRQIDISLLDYYKHIKEKRNICTYLMTKLKAYKIRHVIEKSGYFDRQFYLDNYPDVRQSGIDPILHYLLYGVYEGRNPSSYFDTNDYIKSHPELLLNKINPLVDKIYRDRVK